MAEARYATDDNAYGHVFGNTVEYKTLEKLYTTVRTYWLEVTKEKEKYKKMYEVLWSLRESERTFYSHKRFWNKTIRLQRKKELLNLRQMMMQRLLDLQNEHAAP